MSGTTDGGRALVRRIVVSGTVDRAAVGTVADAVRGELERSAGVEVDVRAVERWEDDALGALASCARIGDGVEILMEGRRGAGPTTAPAS
jgi:hypothetical protein